MYEFFYVTDGPGLLAKVHYCFVGKAVPVGPYFIRHEVCLIVTGPYDWHCND
jgi:hypothetical protein